MKLEKSGNSISHSEFYGYLEESECVSKWLKEQPIVQDEYLNFFIDWVRSSKLNNFFGLKKFKRRFISLGTTQALDWFHYYTKLKNKKLRLLHGEYPYNRDVTDFDYNNDFIVDYNDLTDQDTLIISIPFSGNGSYPEDLFNLLNICDRRNVEVLIDCAWFGTCERLEFDFNHDCIIGATFSTTKGLNCGNYRNGILFTNSKECGLGLQTDWKHGIHLNTFIGLELMKNFSPDTIPLTYKFMQLEVCEKIKINPTNTMHIGLGNENDWKAYRRDKSNYYRINIRKPIKELYNEK
tara:strand:+ start:865 stop:1746 length:882 start_codon:yes stop_codon:yes gene_type:complete